MLIAELDDSFPDFIN